MYYIGMDIHKDNFKLCCYSFDKDVLEHKQTIALYYKLILKYIEQIRLRSEKDVDFTCGYEAGCLDYTLYHQLTSHGIKCVILAPTTMGITAIPFKKRNCCNTAV
jgi:transposase